MTALLSNEPNVEVKPPDAMITGNQRPRLCHIPPFVESSGDEAIELAAMCGLELDEWQQFVLHNALGERADGKWAAATCGLCIGRQNGKSALAEARILFGLFVLGERLILYTAHLQTTATEIFRRLRELIEAMPEFADRVKKFHLGKGQESIELYSGQRVVFITRMASTARGMSADVIIYDEAMHLTEHERSAVTPTLSALSMTGNVQTWYMGSAVDKENPKHDGIPFAQVRESGLNRVDRVTWFEWSAPGDDPDRVTPEERADMSLIAQANPGLGIRISPEWVEHERLVELGARGFAVERMGVGDWPDPNDLNHRAIPIDAWNSCIDLNARMIDPVCFAMDMTPERSAAAIAAAGMTADGKFHVGVIEHKRTIAGEEWIAEKLEALMRMGKPIGLVIDSGSSGVTVIPRLVTEKIEPVTTNAAEYGQACGMFFDAVVHNTLSHHGTTELSDSVLNAVKKSLRDAWKWDKNASGTDISPLVACTLALWGLQTLPPPKKPVRVIDMADVLRKAEGKQ